MITRKKQINNKNKTKKNILKYSYIFGYGSLVNTKDREVTTNRKDKTYPVIIKEDFGYKRSYDFMSSYLRKRRVLGIKKNNNFNTQINGILIKVPNSVIKNLDSRESNSKKLRIKWKHIINYNTTNKLNHDYPIYTYATKQEYSNYNRCDKIWKYYLNLTVRGFLEYGEEFAKLFFETTSNLPKDFSTYEKWKKNTIPLKFLKNKYPHIVKIN